MIPNCVVYRDEGYTTSWISHTNAKEIADYLKKSKKKFEELGANDIREWMKEVIRNGTKNTVVVFAQDVAPDTVFEHIVSSQGGIPDTVFDNIGATALIRQYLDRGGKWYG